MHSSMNGAFLNFSSSQDALEILNLEYLRTNTTLEADITAIKLESSKYQAEVAVYLKEIQSLSDRIDHLLERDHVRAAAAEKVAKAAAQIFATHTTKTQKILVRPYLWNRVGSKSSTIVYLSAQELTHHWPTFDSESYGTLA